MLHELGFVTQATHALRKEMERPAAICAKCMFSVLPCADSADSHIVPQ
jgi:hypothetical protein